MEEIENTGFQQARSYLRCAKCSEDLFSCLPPIGFLRIPPQALPQAPSKPLVYLTCKHIVHYACIDNPRKLCPICPSANDIEQREEEEEMDVDEEENDEDEEVETVPEIEKQELRTFFSSLGLSNEIQNQAVEEVSRDKEKWVELMMKYELGLEKPNPKRAAQSAFNIGFSYIVGGLIPLTPYFFASSGIEGLKISAIITLVCLFIFGYFKSKFTGVNKIGGAFRVMMIGAIAAGCAFAIARLIQGHY